MLNVISSESNNYDTYITGTHAKFYSKLTALAFIKQTKIDPKFFGDKLKLASDSYDHISLACYYAMALGQGNHLL